eukprot:6950701-Prymnesium_polylepis.4
MSVRQKRFATATRIAGATLPSARQRRRVPGRRITAVSSHQQSPAKRSTLTGLSREPSTIGSRLGSVCSILFRDPSHLFTSGSISGSIRQFR